MIAPESADDSGAFSGYDTEYYFGLTTKVSKCPFASATGLRDPHLKQKCGVNENHPHHTSPDQWVKMTH